MDHMTTLPTPEKNALDLGFLKLTDSAPIVMAQEMGFFDQYELKVTLHREVSWANVRDKLIAGRFDAASLLSPLPLVSTAGFGGVSEPMLTGLVLSLNGNAISLSAELFDQLPLKTTNTDAAGVARALKSCIDSTTRKIVLATVHPFSCHTLILRHWLALGGLLDDPRVEIVVLPPEQMADSLDSGVIDGFCVGAPWNTVSVYRGTGVVVATGYDIWNNAPEKVLGVTSSWHARYPATHLRLRLALMEACEWLASYESRRVAANVLARPEYLDLPVPLLEPSLTGNLVFQKGQEPDKQPHFHVFHRFQAGFPWHSDGAWLLSAASAVAGVVHGEQHSPDVVSQVFRTDLFREAAQHLNWLAPSTDSRPFGAHELPWQPEPGLELGADRLLSLAHS